MGKRVGVKMSPNPRDDWSGRNHQWDFLDSKGVETATSHQRDLGVTETARLLVLLLRNAQLCSKKHSGAIYTCKVKVVLMILNSRILSDLAGIDQKISDLTIKQWESLFSKVHQVWTNLSQMTLGFLLLPFPVIAFKSHIFQHIFGNYK